MAWSCPPLWPHFPPLCPSSLFCAPLVFRCCIHAKLIPPQGSNASWSPLWTLSSTSARLGQARLAIPTCSSRSQFNYIHISPKPPFAWNSEKMLSILRRAFWIILYLIFFGLSFLLSLDSVWKCVPCFLLNAWNWDIHESIENHSSIDLCVCVVIQYWTLGKELNLIPPKTGIKIS